MASPKEPIAIVGIGCRLPGNNDSAEALHRFMLEKRSAIRDLPLDRWPARKMFHPDFTKPAHVHVLKGGFIDQVDQFDAGFFDLAPNEAKRMDPQQRLIVETAFEAIEDAGARLEDLAGKAVAVSVGVSANDYETIVGAPTEFANINGNSNTGVASSIVSNRVSYLFDLRGPSYTVDTACSSSLTALHHVCRAIWEGAAEAGLCGGVNLLLKPSTTLGFSKGGYLSPDGVCRAFSDDANGYVRAEGAGVVYLKPLSKALADGDRIRAVIRGTWLNQDGKTPGMTMPSPQAQRELLEGAYRDAGVDPKKVRYVEAHGTGTPAGDPIEATSIGQVLGAGRTGDDRCFIGSVKTNLGHLESASGIAGLIKLALVLEHRQLYPHLNFRAPNPKIPFGELRLEVPLEARALEADGPIYGGINSFGFGGANAHAVLESPPPPRTRVSSARPAEKPQALLLSARTAPALKAYAQHAIAQLETPAPLDAIAGTWSSRKSRFEFRLGAFGAREELVTSLKSWLAGQPAPALVQGRVARGVSERSAFVFSGQGGQWWAMGRTLFEQEPRFRETIEQVSERLRALGWLKSEGSDLIKELHRSEADSRMGQTQIAQPALLALEVAVARLLADHGVVPAAVTGHSIGELSAAHTAGILSLDEAVRIVFWRSRCQALAEGKGSMAALGLSAAQTKERLAPFKGAIELAAINGPASVTVAGTRPEVDALVASLEAEQVFCRKLNVSVPFHCWLMDPVEASFRQELGRVQTQRAKIPFYSTVTGQKLDGEALDLDYWWRNIRAPVDYLKSLSSMVKDGFTHLVEVGPTPSLKQGTQEALTQARARGGHYATLKNKDDERTHLLETVSRLFAAGVPCEAVPLAERAGRLPLPHHPYERQTVWIESKAGRAARMKTAPHPHLETVERRVKNEALFTATMCLDARIDPYLAEHKVQGLMVFPGAGQLEAALAAARLAAQSDDVFLEGVEFRLPLSIEDGDGATRYQLEVFSDEGHFQIGSKSDGRWVEHTKGRVQHGADRLAPARFDVDEVRARTPRPYPPEQVYRDIRASGLDLGPCFRGIRELVVGEYEALARIEVPAKLKQEVDRFLFHPAVLDTLFQSAITSRLQRPAELGNLRLFLPAKVERFAVHQPRHPGPLFAYSKVVRQTLTELVLDCCAIDEAGAPVVTAQGLVVRWVQGSGREAGSALYHHEWTKVTSAEAPRRPQGPWVVLADETNPHTKAALNALRAIGATQVTVHAPASDPSAACAGPKLAGVVHLGLLGDAFGVRTAPHPASGHPLPEERVHPNLVMAETLGPVAAARWIGALLEAGKLPPQAEVWLCTRGLHDEKPWLEGASLWGFGRVLMSEQPRLVTTLVDLPRAGGPSLLSEQLARGPEHAELKLSAPGERETQSLVRSSALEPPMVNVDVATTPVRAVVRKQGLLQSMALERQSELLPGPNELVVAVKATSLNFKDVVVAMGLMPPQAWEKGLTGTEVGIDCAGVVHSVGAKVTKFKVGDEVVGFAPACLGNRARSDQALWVKKPKQSSFEQAATVPLAFLTAALALESLARLQKGESVLVHAGSGGVGLAAIQIARALGARVFTSAGSETKRAYLESLGVEKVFDSRQSDFRQAVMDATDGVGVDVVLNSLSGRLLAQSVRCLAPFGRFVEIGKTDIYSNRQIGLEYLGENRSFQVLDVNRWVAGGHTRQAISMLEQIFERIGKGELHHLPQHVYPLTDATQALHALSQAQQIGKLVVSVPSTGAIEARATQLLLDPKASYLITGGTQGFGLDVAGLLAHRGARHLVLVSRHGVPGEREAAKVAAIEAQGVKVEVVRCDVAELEAVRALVARLPNLKGVIHGAMVLDDAAFTKLDAERFAKVSRPKALGAWNLHLATAPLGLEHFVMFSSIASVVGTPGQGNYAAANAVLDHLAKLRAAEGKVATVVNFGVLDTGVVERASAEQRRKIGGQGVGALTSDEAVDLLEQIMLSGRTEVVAAKVDWNRVSQLERGSTRPSRFAALTASGGAGAKTDDASFREQLLELPAEARSAFLAGKIAAHVATIAGLEGPADIDSGLTRFGLDSMMSIQLQGWLEDQLKVSVPLMRILRGTSIRELSEEIVQSAARSKDSARHGWLSAVHRVEEPKARLLCFGYMGADADPFGGWASSLPEGIELWSVHYPDLGGEHDALLRGPQDELIAATLAELEELLELPFALYGHSMGAWVALDMARALERQGKPPKFVATGAMPSLATMRTLIPTTATTPEEISNEYVLEAMGRMQIPAQLLEQPSFLQKAVGRTRRDLWLGVHAEFQADRERQPKCPLYVFGGSKDPVVTVDKDVGPLKVSQVIHLDGSHLFLEESEPRLRLVEQLSSWLLASPVR